MQTVKSMRPYKANAYHGYYKNNYLRSLNEFIYALYLEFVQKEHFCSEGIKLTSPITGKHKIPDFIIFNDDNSVNRFVEIKPNAKEIEELIVQYTTHLFSTVKIDFITTNRRVMTHLKKLIAEKIGFEELNRLEKDYKAQRDNSKCYSGFPGKLNPMFNKHHSIKSKKLISLKKTGMNSGKDNPNFGNHLTDEAKVRVGAKWYDEASKKRMKIKGFITHIGKLNTEQHDEFIKYATLILSGCHAKRPKYINRAYTVSIKKINELFGSVELFFTKIVRNYE